MRQAGDSLLPEYGRALLEALDDCVVYQVTGSLRSNASGLSKYYNLDGDYANFMAYTALRDDDPFHWFFEFLLTGSLSAEGERYVIELAQMYSRPRAVRSRSVPDSSYDGLEDFPLIFGDDGYVTLNLGPQIAAKLTGVYCQLARYDEEHERITVLGRSSDLYEDWENGVFKDAFYGMWGSIDGCLVYMELSDESDGYQLYTVPILLNGEEYALSVSYIYGTGEYGIIGARRGIDENGMSDRFLRQLRPGDVVEPLLYYMLDIDDSEDITMMAVERLVVAKNTRFGEANLGDGTFVFFFEMLDASGNSYLSEGAMFTVEDGEIYLAG